MSTELINMSACEVVDLLRQKELHPAELIDALEARHAEVDGVINALPVTCWERARSACDGIDPEQQLLAGLPLPIKDLTDVAGVRTTYASRAFADHVPQQSDTLVELLEANGAVIYAKSNTPEFGTGGNTVNFVHGNTVNPWDTRLSAAGSSGGAAAALASGTAWLAQGSDMGGSLRNPASFCGVAGLRPTVGRVVSTLSGSVFNTLSTNGPMARNIADLALGLDAMVGRQPGVPIALDPPAQSFLSAARNPGIRGAVAFSMDLGITPVDSAVRTVIQRAVDRLADAGVEIVEAAPDFVGVHEIFHVLRAHDYASGLSGLLESHGHLLHPNVAWNIEQGLSLTRAEVARAEADRVALVQRVQRFFGEYPVMLNPATVVPPYSIDNDHVGECDGHVFDNYYRWLGIAYAFTTAICPALSMPGGFTDDGLPVGLQVAAGAFEEARLLSTAARIEAILDLDPGTPRDPEVRP